MADLNEKIQKVLDTKDTTSDYDSEDIKNNKVVSILAYFGILFLIPLLAAKDSKFAKYHANQGLTLCLAWVIVAVVIGALGNIPFIWWLFDIIGALASLAGILLMIVGIINAANGKAKELPFIGNITFLK